MITLGLPITTAGFRADMILAKADLIGILGADAAEGLKIFLIYFRKHSAVSGKPDTMSQRRGKMFILKCR